VRGSVRLDAPRSSRVRRDHVQAAGTAHRHRLPGPAHLIPPVYRIGDQIAEALRVHQDLSREQARRRVVELLDLVGIPDPERRANAFPPSSPEACGNAR